MPIPIPIFCIPIGGGIPVMNWFYIPIPGILVPNWLIPDGGILVPNYPAPKFGIKGFEFG